MECAGRILKFICRQLGVLLAVGLLTIGLTGCYTQLETLDRRADTRSPRAEQADDGSTYAREYRREYRGNESRSNWEGEEASSYRYEYKYRYKYGAPYRYSHGFYDPFFYDPFWDDPFYRPYGYRPYGSHFSLSFRYGSPYYYGHPGSSWYDSPWGYGRYAGAYGRHYYGPNYHYYGAIGTGTTGQTRAQRPRGSTMGRGTTRADAGPSVDRSGSRTTSVLGPAKSSSSTGRIGRSTQSDGAQRSTIGRSSAERPDRVRRSSRTRTDRSIGRVGRSNSRDAAGNRTTRTRRTRPDRDNVSSGGTRSRTRSTRTRTRSKSSGSSTRSSRSERSRDRDSDDGR